MKEILEKILSHLPAYFVTFGQVFSSPKAFIREKNKEPECAYNEALIFLAISMSVVIIMTSSLIPNNYNFWKFVGGTVISWIACWSLVAASVRVAWRCVGGKASTRSFFVTEAYYLGVIATLSTVVFLVAIGMLRLLAPDIYDALHDPEQVKQLRFEFLINNTAVLSSLIFIYVGLLGCAIWGYIGWGAYRELNGLSKARSFLAFLIQGVANLLVVPVLLFLQAALL